MCPDRMTSDTHRNGGSPASGADPSSTSSTWNHPVPSGTVIWPGNSNSCTSSEFECKIGDILLACSMFLPQGQSFFANFLYPKIRFRDNKNCRTTTLFDPLSSMIFQTRRVELEDFPYKLPWKDHASPALRRGFEMIDAAAKKLRRHR